MARDCVTHHHACDCREARFREIEAAAMADNKALARLFTRWLLSYVHDDVTAKRVDYEAMARNGFSPEYIADLRAMRAALDKE